MSKNSGGLMNNLLWKFAERISAQFVTLFVSIILARILEPEHYGIISIVMIFITIANVLVSDGFGNALIQKKDADALDFSSVLWFNLGFSVFLYAILYVSAPYITAFYGDGYELITPVLRVLGTRLIVSSINSVQQAYVSRHMIFRKFFWATLLGTVVSAVVGIFMAYRGFGVWALVGQYLTNTTIDTVVLQIALRRMPMMQFSWKRLRELIGYGSKVLLTGLLVSGYQELQAVIIGKLYSSADLAYYDKAKQFPAVLSNNINTSIGAVLFPQMSKYQDDPAQIKEIARRSIRVSAYVMCPLTLGLASVAKSFVIAVLTEKWLPCVPLLQLLCINNMCMPMHNANMQAIKAIGRSDVLLKLEIVKKTVELLVLISMMRIGVTAITAGKAVCATAFVFVNAFPNRKLINYSYKEQLLDLAPALLMSLVMAGTVYGLGMMEIPALPLLVLQVAVGGILYVGMSAATKNHEFVYLAGKLRSFLGK